MIKTKVIVGIGVCFILLGCSNLVDRFDKNGFITKRKKESTLFLNDEEKQSSIKVLKNKILSQLQTKKFNTTPNQKPEKPNTQSKPKTEKKNKWSLEKPLLIVDKVNTPEQNQNEIILYPLYYQYDKNSYYEQKINTLKQFGNRISNPDSLVTMKLENSNLDVYAYEFKADKPEDFISILIFLERKRGNVFFIKMTSLEQKMKLMFNLSKGNASEETIAPCSLDSLTIQSPKAMKVLQACLNSSKEEDRDNLKRYIHKLIWKTPHMYDMTLNKEKNRIIKQIQKATLYTSIFALDKQQNIYLLKADRTQFTDNISLEDALTRKLPIMTETELTELQESDFTILEEEQIIPAPWNNDTNS